MIYRKIVSCFLVSERALLTSYTANYNLETRIILFIIYISGLSFLSFNNLLPDFGPDCGWILHVVSQLSNPGSHSKVNAVCSRRQGMSIYPVDLLLLLVLLEIL